MNSSDEDVVVLITATGINDAARRRSEIKH
jgi:hypothetical protein